MRRSSRWMVPVLLALAALPLGGAPAAAQEEPSGPRLRGNFLELSFGGRVQTQLATTTVDGEPPSEIFLRRVRLEATVRVNELVSGKIAPDFARDRVSVKDAYLRLDLHPAVGLLAGRAFKPFGLLEQTSSTRILPIERGASIPGLGALDEYEIVNELQYSDRDVGVQLLGSPEGAPLGLSYAAGVFRGPLQGSVGGESSYQFAARATVEPLPELRLGLGWSTRDFARDAGGEALELRRGNAFEVDAEYGAFDPGLHLLAEVALGDFDPFTDTRFAGAHAWLGWRSQPVGAISGIEPILRLSYGSVDDTQTTPDAGGLLLTPGINLHLGGLNRLQLNYDLWSPNADGADREGSLKAQFQLAF